VALGNTLPIAFNKTRSLSLVT